jgi:hypothetical protein
MKGRLAAAVAAAGICAAIIGTGATPALASRNPQPTVTATTASFTIPATPTGDWQLMLWSIDNTTAPATETLVGKAGPLTSGTLTINVPQTSTCYFQADVRYIPTGGTKYVFFSGKYATVPGCGQNGTGTRLTPGYWKNHASATQLLLPQWLGNYEVTTSAEATAIFDAMKCNNAINCLAGHLLAAELDIAGGSSTCISATIYDANHLLAKKNYDGPHYYKVSSTKAAEALALESALDSYTNDGTSASC